MKNQIKVKIEEFPFTNISKHTINDKVMFILDNDLNLPGEKFILAGYKAILHLKFRYYTINSNRHF